MLSASGVSTITALLALAGCGSSSGLEDAASADAAPIDADHAAGDGAVLDGAAGDGTTLDAPTGSDGSSGDGDGGSGGDDGGSGSPDAAGGVITGGPCMSGAAGATAYRVRWADGGGTAYVVYEVNGLPDKSRDHTGAYGYQIGYTPSYVDPYLAQGGLQLNSSCFVDIELSTVGLSQIQSASLSVYGRSYNTTTSGSFNWQTFVGVGSSPTNLVSNSAPYEWYSADMTTEIVAADDGVLIRIEAGPSSNSLVVNRIEICMDAL